jgi:hypothetical protein
LELLHKQPHVDLLTRDGHGKTPLALAKELDDAEPISLLEAKAK